MRVAIVGAGFSGIGAAVELRRAGIEDVTVFEKADDIGGVWHANTYPGAACDILSYLYSFSYAQRKDWSQPCSPQAEILAYLRDVARREGVADRVRLGTEIVRADFDAATARWTLHSADDETFAADAVILGCGQLSRPALPAIEGMDAFAGPAFHSAEWDHSVALRGRRIGVIGTGATAIQFLPRIAPGARRVDVYQRTPPYLLPRRNRRFPAWKRALIRHVPGLQALRRLALFGFLEGGTLGLTRFRPGALALTAWSRLFLALQVRDRALRAKLTPDYPIGCKRVLLSTYWLPTLQRPNVDLVTDGIARITERGIVTEDGREREVDVIVYSTGFRAHDFVVPLEVRGTEGRALTDAWSGGPEAHLGIAVAGFPGLFLMYGPNTNLGFGSIIVMIEAQARYVVQALRAMERCGGALDVRPEVQRRSTAAVRERLQGSVWTACQSWYRDAASGRVVNNWPGLMQEYRAATKHLDEDDFRVVTAA